MKDMSDSRAPIGAAARRDRIGVMRMRTAVMLGLMLLVGLLTAVYGQGAEFAVRGGVSNGGAWGGPYWGYYGPYAFTLGVAPAAGATLAYNVNERFSAGIEADYWWKTLQYSIPGYYSLNWTFSDLAFGGFGKYNFTPGSSFQLAAGAGASMHVPRMSITYDLMGQQYTYGGSSSYVGFHLLVEGGSWVSENMRVFLQAKYMYYTYLSGGVFTIGMAWGRRGESGYEGEW